MKFILAKKIEMSQIFRPDGRVVPVTILDAGPCVVTQVKTNERDGYTALQVGFGTRKRLSQSLKGHFKNAGSFRFVREVRVADSTAALGASLDVSQFQEGEDVTVVGVSKGKGFQGVVRRHHFHGHPPTHGHKDAERMPGSIGPGGKQHVEKGRRMGGRMGADRTTVKNLEIVKIEKEQNRLWVKGAVPGARNGLLMVYSAATEGAKKGTK